MKNREFQGHEATAAMNFGAKIKPHSCEIDPIIKKFAGLSTRETPATKRRFRIMKNMAKEMLDQGFYPNGVSTEEYLVKFFSEIYASQ